MAREEEKECKEEIWYTDGGGSHMQSQSEYCDVLVDVFESRRHLCDMAEVMFEEDFLSLSPAVERGFRISCVIGPL